mgnify:FL=1
MVLLLDSLDECALKSAEDGSSMLPPWRSSLFDWWPWMEQCHAVVLTCRLELLEDLGVAQDLWLRVAKTRSEVNNPGSLPFVTDPTVYVLRAFSGDDVDAVLASRMRGYVGVSAVQDDCRKIRAIIRPSDRRQLGSHFSEGMSDTTGQESAPDGSAASQRHAPILLDILLSL